MDQSCEGRTYQGVCSSQSGRGAASSRAAGLQRQRGAILTEEQANKNVLGFWVGGGQRAGQYQWAVRGSEQGVSRLLSIK